MRKLYRNTVAVDHVDLDVPEGAVLGMLGPNGSGRTTTIRLLLGLTTPTWGEIELFAPGCRKPQGGALVEGPGFHPFLSGRDNLLRCAAAEPLLKSKAIPGAVDAIEASVTGYRRRRGVSVRQHVAGRRAGPWLSRWGAPAEHLS